MSDAETTCLPEDRLLLPTELRAEIARVPEERQQRMVGAAQNGIRTNETFLTERLRLLDRIGMQYDRAVRRPQRVDVRAACEIPEAQLFYGRSEQPGDIVHVRPRALLDELLRKLEIRAVHIPMRVPPQPAVVQNL